jgi:hypothetical protein
VFDFERLHQAARDARAKGQRKVMLPHGEFRQAMLTFYAMTKGKRALDQIEEGRFSFSAWGRRIPAATRSSSAMTILDAEKFAPSKNGGDRRWGEVWG